MNHEGAHVEVVLGTQWGDEGKGKLIDLLAARADVVARCQGGNNAGHTVVADGVKYKFHLLPSGMLNPVTVGVLGNGVVVHVGGLLQEVTALRAQGVEVLHRLQVSDRAHLLFDFHQIVDGLWEEERGGGKIGTTRKGIGPCYASKASRTGLRVGDLRHFRTFVDGYLRSLANEQKRFNGFAYDVKRDIAQLYQYALMLETCTIDSVKYMNQMMNCSDRCVLIEGANAALLDIDFGTYPFVTSSNCSVGGICTGLGVSPRRVRNIGGVMKAYTTRVGEGPFPTELDNEVGRTLQVQGGEFGATTGRPRRCGWLDVVNVAYTNSINGYDYLCLTKLDVLSHLDEIRIGVKYVHRGKQLDYYPSSLTLLSEVDVQYETLEGWKGNDISSARELSELPVNARKFVSRVEELLGVPVRYIGVGASRSDIIRVEGR
mmetsp:Transcript_11689/g.23795  ORF Transcript_11689/g.23795 Transcript_11689/m.23795 type:complete len:431 (+) Transcript_11689:2377-3669(+)